VTKEQTRVLRHRVLLDNAKPSVTPIFQASAFEAGSPYFYTRKANPNVVEFEEAVAILEDAPFACAVSTGMAAIQSVLNYIPIHSSLVIHRLIYGCSYKFFERVASRMKLDLHVMDLNNKDDLQKIPQNTSMIFFETPTNPFLDTIAIQEISDLRKQICPNALVVVDNTWAGPLCQRPLKWGADVSLHSATKYFSGHSDVMGGILLTARPELDEFFKQERFFGGAIMDPHSAWLLRRSLQTFELRTREQSRVSKEMLKFLNEIPQIAKVYFPKIDEKQLTDYPGILFFEFAEKFAAHPHETYIKFRDSLKCFGTGTGMAAVTSMIAQPYSGSHASMTDKDKELMGLSPNLVRLCFGLESIEDLKADLTQAFGKM